MSGYNHFYQQISPRTAVGTRLSLSSDTDTLSIVDTCRDRDSNLLLACRITGSVAVRALVFDNLTGSVTVRTRTYILHHAKERLLSINHLALSSAFRASLGCSTRFCSGTMTGLTLIF